MASTNLIQSIKVSAMKTKTYYQVMVKYPESENWEIHFGDYSREVARDEADDVRSHNDYAKPGDKVKVKVVPKQVSYEQYQIDTGATK